MTIFFDAPEIRRQFLRDVEGLIVYHDQANRDETDRLNFEETLSFFLPDLDQGEHDPVTEPWCRMNLARAEKAVSSSSASHSSNHGE